VRELENVVERAVTLATGPRITLADLPDALDPGRLPAPRAVSLPTDGMDLDAFLAETEQRLLLEALERSGGVRKRAARLVGMTFRSFRYRLTKYGLGDTDDVADDTDGPGDVDA
jgi:two-component system response regulator PilR (NtrC family)